MASLAWVNYHRARRGEPLLCACGGDIDVRELAGGVFLCSACLEEEKMTNDNCDGSGPHAAGTVRLMPTGGDGNLILCRACWRRELSYRRERNRVVADPCSLFPEPCWEEGEIYGEDQ